MPSFTQVLKDTSPMLVYSANWRAGTSETDNLADQYTQSSFTLTQTEGDSMSFGFFGTTVGVFGARRSNHGNYEVQIDGQSFPTVSGQSATPEFIQPLVISNMSLGLHNMTIINRNNSFIDIDYVTFQTNVGNDNEDLIVNTYQDTHPAFVYVPASAWTTPAMVGTFLGGSGHATTQPSSAAMLTFKGDAVALYGPVGPNATAAYSVQVDNGTPSLLSSNKQFYRPQQMLFYAGNLGAGQHTLKVQLGSTSSGEFAIDYANVYTAPSLGGSFLTVASNSSHLPPGTLAALAITTTLAILASLLCIYLFWRQRFELLHYSPATPSKPKIPLQAVEPFALSSAMEASLGSLVAVPSGAPSRLRSEVQRMSASVYSSVPSSTIAGPPSAPGAPSEVETTSNSRFYVHGSRESQVVQEYTRDNEKGGFVRLGYEAPDHFDLPTAASNEYVGHPPPEYS